MAKAKKKRPQNRAPEKNRRPEERRAPRSGPLETCDRILNHYAMKKQAAGDPPQKKEPTRADWGYAIRDFAVMGGLLLVLVFVALRNGDGTQAFPIALGGLLILLFAAGIARMAVLRRDTKPRALETADPPQEKAE